MTLLFPLGLAALAAWLLPLLIHLARRHPYTPLDFAALRWLRAQIRPRQRIRFDDWPLLLVRLLLLAALALLLARPALTGPAPLPAAWTVVAPGLDATALRGTAEEGNWHWLAPGFPAIDHAPPVSSASLPSLLRELDAQLPAGTALTVHVPDPLPGLDGARLQLSRDVQWHTQPMPVTPPQTAVALPRLRVHSEASATTQHWLNALQRAWGVQALPSPLAEDVVPERGEIGVWSRNDALPANWQAWLRDGGLVMRAGKPAASARILLRDAEGVPLLWQQRIGQGQLLSLPGDWNAASNAALRDPQLPRALLLALQPPTAPRLGDARDQAPHRAALPAVTPPPREPTPWLLLAIVLLLALERWMASSAQRRVAA
ncbi:TPA: BatA domain-containing protein [Stenotrophomonas maltophilia]